MPSLIIAWPRTTAVVVPSPGDVVGLGRNFLEQLGPHILERVFQLDVAGDRDPVVVMVGEPNFLSRTTFRPLGPIVTLTPSPGGPHRA